MVALRGSHQRFTLQGPMVCQGGLDLPHLLRVPAGVHYADAGQIKPQGKRREPLRDLGMKSTILLDFIKKDGVLVSVPLRMWA
ncbi:hypothetical protein GCM10011404_30530 [Sphingomonas prati]|nr:hypothetical protein GCM10011404_30530 [Sphingomonas prati]